MAAGTVKQAHSQLVFEGLDTLRHGSLGDKMFFGSFCKIETFCNRYKIGKLIGGHKASFRKYIKIWKIIRVIKSMDKI